MRKLNAEKTFNLIFLYLGSFSHIFNWSPSSFKKEAESGTTAIVKNAAAQGQEVIARHLDMIEKIAQSHHVPVQSSGGAQ